MRFKLFSAFLILTVFVLIGSGCAGNNQLNNTSDPQGMILFVGAGCPHCDNVEKFVKENNIDDKITFDVLEVYNNKNNSALLTQKAQLCGIPLNALGVPLFWDGSKCLLGDIDIIDFLETKI